jgi:CxxC motif-containing protein (DUF1111 family)
MQQAPLFWAFAAVLALAPMWLRPLRREGPRPLVDAALVQAGEELFSHEWKPADPRAAGDGLGPVYNATSCAACHFQNGVGGSGGLGENVTTFSVRAVLPGQKPREGVVHAYSVILRGEMLAHIHPQLPATGRLTLEMIVHREDSDKHPLTLPVGVHISQRNTPALFGIKMIDDIPSRVLLTQERRERRRWAGIAPGDEAAPVGRALRLADGRVGRFGWKAQTATLATFVRAACANELGLGNRGHEQPRPLGVPDYQAPGLDLSDEQCDQLTAFVASLPRPVQRLPADAPAAAQVRAGQRLFHEVGCADCHTPDLGAVRGLYSDLLLHRMGPELEGSGSYTLPPVPMPDTPMGDGPAPSEWRTPPLWGVADSAPYLHDGRAATLTEAIHLHAGQATRSAQRFAQLNQLGQDQVIAFLQTLHAP